MPGTSDPPTPAAARKGAETGITGYSICLSGRTDDRTTSHSLMLRERETMRQRNAGHKPGRNTSHRRTLRNLTTSILLEDRVKRIITKAKVARPHVEKLITLDRCGDPHSRRLALSCRPGEPSVRYRGPTIPPRLPADHVAGDSGKSTEPRRHSSTLRRPRACRQTAAAG